MTNKMILIMISVVLGFSACKSKPENKAQLTANEWELKEMKTTDGKVTLPQEAPTLVLTDTNTMHGFAGCNRFFGTYLAKENTLKFESVGMTRMACPDMEFEDEYMTVLERISSYSVENKELKLTDKEKKRSLVFIPKAKK